MKYIFTLLVLILTQLNSIAQYPGAKAAGANMNMGHFYGKIVDLNNKGLEGITIQLKGNKFDPVTKKTTESILGTMLSAANGDFSFENLPVMGNFKLIVTGVGYKRLEKQLSFNLKMGGGQSMQEMMALVDKDLGNIKIEENANELQSVTVSSTSKPQFEMGIDRKIFNVEKNLTSQGQTAVEVMKSIPNLNVDIDGNVTLRNAAPTLLIDNRPTTLTLDQIPADIIERVEIITNPSAKYDATGGNAGILNIVLKKNRKNGYNGGIRSGIDMRGKFNGGGDLNLRDNKFNFSLNANINGRKSISTSTNDREILGVGNPTHVRTNNDNTGEGSFNFYRAGVDFIADNRNTFSLYGNIMQGEMASTGTQTIDSTINAITRQYNLSNSSQFKFLNKGAQLSYKHLFAEKGHELSADANYNQAENDNWSIVNSSIINQRSLGLGNNKNYTFNIDYAREFKDEAKFEAGIRYNDRSEYNKRDQFRNNQLIDAISSQYQYGEKVYAAYSNINMKKNNWSFQLGLRAESRSYNGTILNKRGLDSLPFSVSYPISLFPSAFINYKVNDKQDLQINYSKRINPPNFFQLLPFPDYSDPQNISVGNPGLKPQFTHSFEVAYNNAYKKGSNFLATAYYKYSTDLITSYVYRDINRASANLDSAYFSSSINANTAIVYGLELSNKTAVTKWWDLNLSFNLFKSAVNATIPGQNVNNDLTSWFSKMNNTFKLPNGFSYQFSGQYQAKTILPPGGNSAGGGGGRGGMGGGGGGWGGPQSTAQGYNFPAFDFDMALKKDWTLSGGRTASLSFSVNDVFKTRVNKTFSQSQYFTQTATRVRDQQFFRLNFTYRFGKFDVNLLRRKSTKGDEGGGGMDQMPQ